MYNNEQQQNRLNFMVWSLICTEGVLWLDFQRFIKCVSFSTFTNTSLATNACKYTRNEWKDGKQLIN